MIPKISTRIRELIPRYFDLDKFRDNTPPPPTKHFLNQFHFHPSMPAYKQALLVRQDLQLPKGKLAGQVAHASVEAAFNSNKKVVEAWRNQGMPKIVLKVKDEKELLSYFQLAKEQGLTAALISDAGKTVLVPGTKTCVGIGPDDEDRIDKVTGTLKLL